MHREDIKAGLRKAGSSLAKIARDLGVGRAVMTQTIDGARSERVERAIAQVLGKDVRAVFPDRTYKDEAA